MRNSFLLSKKIARITTLFLVFVLLGSVEGFSETEPNDSRETANPLAINSSISGSFSQAEHSSDYFKLTTTGDGKMVITVSSDQALCVSLTVVSENGTINLYHNGYCGSSSYSNTITINNLATGIYYIWADHTGYGSYTISNTFTSATLTNDTEPNDSRETALSFSPNTEKTGHLGYKNTSTDYYDYYKIVTTTDGKLTINVTPDASLCIDLTVISESGYINLYSNGNCGYTSHNDALVINNLAAGTYYISASATGYGSYRISNTLVAATLANDIEPNNTRETALTFSPNSQKTGHLGYRNTNYTVDDYDYYKITTTSDGKLTINVVPDQTLCVNLTVISESGYINLYTNGNCGYTGHTDALVVNNLAAGTYYIQAATSGYGSYTISNTLDVATLTNDAEPNGTRETAITFNQNSSVTGHLGYKNTTNTRDDYDYYKLTTTADGKLTINITPTQTLCVNLTVISESGYYNLYTNGNCGYTGHTNTLVINNLAAGIYYISVAPSEYGSYTLSNTLEATTLTNDLEPNDTRETAITLPQSGNVTGHLGYKNTSTDDKDYYKIVTASNINFTVSVTSDPTLCVNLTLMSSDGSVYLLTNGTCGNTSHTDTMTKNALAAGTYYILAAPTGYGSYRITTSYTFVSGVNELDSNGIAIFPNPAKNEIFLSGTDLINSDMKVCDINGRTVLIQKINSNDQFYRLDVSELKAGMYFIELRNGKSIKTEKFIKEE